MEELHTLVSRCRSGDLGSFEELVRRFQDMAYGYSYSILGDFHSAQDAAQEAFLDAYRQLPSLRDPKAFPGWFRRIVFKHCDRITRRKRMTSVPLDDSKACELTYPDSADIIAQAEEREQVLSAVRSLPEGHRTVTTLFYINGYSQREIADFLELPVTTVKKRIYDSRQRLKERMVDLVSESLRRHSLSSDFTDIVVRKAASLSDLERASAFIDYHARHHPEHFKSVDAAAKAGVFVVGREGEVSGAGYFGEAAWSIGSTIIRRALIDEIGGEGKGVPDPAFLMGCKGALKLAKEQGINIAVVHGSQFDHGLCGFVPCFYYAVATLSTDRARQVQTRATVREVRDADEAEEGWRAFMTDPYSTKGWGLIGPALVTHVVEDRNEVVGYLAVHPDGNRRARKYGLPFGFMPTVTLKTREAALAAIKLHGDLAAEAGGDEIVVLQSHMTEITKTILSLGGRYVLRPSCDEIGLDAEVVAVTDFLGLTKELEDEFNRRLGISRESIGREGIRREATAPGRRFAETSGSVGTPVSAEESFSLEVNGEIVSFSTTCGGLSIGQERCERHLVLPTWAATRLYTGYYSGEDLLSIGTLPGNLADIEGMQNAAEDLFEVALPEPEASLFIRLFPKLWPCSMPDPDVWPWVIGEPHQRYRHGDEEPAELKARIDELRLPWIGY
jgi:RNA polymerase sigma factor (sigma-70 family)